MAVVQDTYSAAPAKGFPGMVANMEPSNRISRTVEDAAGVAFGAPVYRGVGDHGCTGTVGTALTFLGFVIAEPGTPVLPGGVAADIVPQYASAAIMTDGCLYVTAGAGGVVDGGIVTIGAGASLADGISDTAADATHILAPGWVFDETAAAGAIVRIARR
jgi:hypothetical protein